MFTKVIKIGVPRSLLYYKYRYLWEAFFGELGCRLIFSPKTNKEILNEGVELSVDENCLPIKLYLGHVSNLVGKADFVLIPRIVSLSKDQQACTKFNATYDIVANIFPKLKIIEYSIDVENGITEKKEFIRIGQQLGNSRKSAVKAYQMAQTYQDQKNKEKEDEQKKLLKEKSGNLKILIVSHPYNIYDELVGKPILDSLKRMGADLIMADLFDEEEAILLSERLSERLYWTANKELIGALEYYKKKVDGIIFVITFPCGPDSLVVELISRKLKNIPTTTLVLDEHQGEAGLKTRLESFIDIIKMRKGKKSGKK